MNPCLHPEEAMDMALGGTLPAAQHRDLNLHLAACAARAATTRAGSLRSCGRWPSTTGWPRLKKPWSVIPGSSTRSCPPARMTGLFPPRFARLRYRRAFRLGFALAGLLLAGGMAGATLWRLHRSSPVPLLLPEPSGATIQAAPAASRAVPSPAAEPAPLSDEPALQRSSRAQPSAAVLFAQALALRGEGKVDAAIAAHLRLQRLYPAARETRVSLALAGRLLLERGSSEQALAQFNQYLAQPGDIAEEALVGRATALGRLGRSATEAAAWRDVLERYPGSIYAAHAEKRLSALAEKPRAAAESGSDRRH